MPPHLNGTRTGCQSFALHTVAKTLWGEARGEGVDGMLAVANVIRNRTENPSWWGDSYTDVCLKSRQFSCWNEDDPNRSKLDHVTVDDPQYLIAVGIAALIIADALLPDTTNGATHYLVTEWIPKTYWTKALVAVATIGRHTFFKEP